MFPIVLDNTAGNTVTQRVADLDRAYLRFFWIKFGRDLKFLIGRVYINLIEIEENQKIILFARF